MAFVWEKERISNDEVMRCTADYMDHISSFNFLPSLKKNSSSSSSSHLPSSSPPSTTTTTSSSSVSSPADSSSSGWNWFSWFSYSSAGDSSVLASSLANSSSSSSSSGDACEVSSQSYSAWLWSWITWSTPTDNVLRTENVNVDGSVQEHEVCETPPPHNEPTVGLSARELRLEQYRQMTWKTRVQLEEEAARRPLVGMIPREDWRDMNIGPRLIEYAMDKAKTKVSKLWKERVSPVLASMKKHNSLESKKGRPGNSVADLACIGCGGEFYESSTKDLYKLFMQVDLDGKNGSNKDNKMQSRLNSHLQNLDIQLADYCSGVQTHFGYFQEELLFDGLYGSPGPVVDNVIEETVKDAVERGLHFCLYGIAKFPSKVQLKKEVGRNQSCSCKTLDFSLKLQGLDHFGFGTWKRPEKAPTKLVVLTDEMARAIYIPSTTINIPTSSLDVSSDPLCDWECINKDTHYMAYRRLYKDTGLYQYKVIGQFDDITARDFLAVQVNHSVRKNWDAYAGDLYVVETDQLTNCKLIHWIMKYPFPMSPREYLFVQRVWTSEKNDLVVMMNRGSTHPSVQSSHHSVRVNDYFSDMVIQADSTVDKPGMRFELTYFDNPKSNLPSSCVNWVTFRALPEFMSKIHEAATAHGEVQLNQ